jgi:dihydrofolate reductase
MATASAVCELASGQCQTGAVGQIAVHEFVSLDSVFEDPAWTFEVGFDPAMGERIGQITDAADGILLGRTTYEMFAPAWSSRTAEDDPGAPFFNDTRKYVVATAPPAVDWGPVTILDGYDADAIRDLKHSSDGLLYVSGSGTLVRALLGDGLVDQLHLFVFPMLLGSGQRLFDDTGDRRRLTLREHTAYPNGVVHLHYAPA